MGVTVRVGVTVGVTVRVGVTDGVGGIMFLANTVLILYINSVFFEKNQVKIMKRDQFQIKLM